jgi:CxxC motif-containing protein (DUF1111 family)
MTIAVERAIATCLAALLIVTTASILGNGPAPTFGNPLAGITASQLARFQAGVAEFDNAETISDGLGPVFNAPLVGGKDVTSVSCATCHADPVSGGGSSTQFETRFGRVTSGVFDPLASLGGSLIQNQGIGNGPWGFNFVGEVVPPQANVTAKRRTTPLFGAGLVEAVPDDALLMLAAQQQFQSPQVGGRASTVVDPTPADPTPSHTRVGRFGWKAQHALLITFAGDAYLNEMGITTPLFPTENCPQGNCASLAFNPVPAVNDDNASLQAFADFMALLAPPPIQPIPPAGRGGEKLFATLGCAFCHVPTLQTGQSAVAALNLVPFHPFSDFLLHDMGSLGDGIVQGGTGAREMRTAPLWGLRNVTALLHDGRAATIEAAILAHDGQARPARDRFARLRPGDQACLIAFLKSL